MAYLHLVLQPVEELSVGPLGGQGGTAPGGLDGPGQVLQPLPQRDVQAAEGADTQPLCEALVRN